MQPPPAGSLPGIVIQIRVDPRRCIATKACMNAAEGVFAIVGGVSVVVDASAASSEDLALAADACPVGAITLEREEAGSP